MENSSSRIDPTLLLPDEEMSYEIKSKKKKKKKKKKDTEDPLKDCVVLEDKGPVTIEYDADFNAAEDVNVNDDYYDVSRMKMDPDVTIKVEDVELDFHDFTGDDGIQDHTIENNDEPAVRIENQAKIQPAIVLTFQNNMKKEKTVVKKEKLDVKNVVKNVPLPKIDDSKEGEEENDKTKVLNQDLMCETCLLVFQSERTLRIHQIRKHDIKKKSFKHVCEHCGIRYEQKTSLDVHMKRKHDPNVTQPDYEEKTCQVCSQVFKGPARLRMHMLRQHGLVDENFKHECDICGLSYERYRSLLVHKQRKHSGKGAKKKIAIYKCKLCPKIYNSRDPYVRHMQRKHHNEDNKIVPAKILDSLLSMNAVTGEIPCKECPMFFSSPTYLKLHMRRYHSAFQEDYKIKCLLCNMSYNKNESLRRHILRKHSENFFCEVCQKLFENKEQFDKHSHEKIAHECKICGQIFASKGGLGKHSRCKHNQCAGKQNFFCNICEAGFTSKKQLKVHQMRDHLKVTYPCKLCNKVFRTKESCKTHYMRLHPVSFPTCNNYKCFMCDASFNNEKDLCSHHNSSHNLVQSSDITPTTVKCENEESVTDVKIEPKEVEEATEVEQKKEGINYHCPKCSATYNSFSTLRQHFDEEHKFHEQTQCQSCGELIYVKDLDKHMKTKHPVKEDLKCLYCDFETTSKTKLSQHTLRHTDATSIPCTYEGCKYKSYYEDAMKKHLKKHTDLGSKLQCSKCPFQTMNKYILRYHEEEHETGKKKYTCDQCDYSTILPSNLVHHKYKHSQVKRFKCDSCPFATKYNTSLRFHVRKKHCDLTGKSSDV